MTTTVEFVLKNDAWMASVLHKNHYGWINHTPHCTVSSNVTYIHWPILEILRWTLLILTIPIKCDVFNVLHDDTGHVIIGK